jgi:hypothetical protein
MFSGYIKKLIIEQYVVFSSSEFYARTHTNKFYFITICIQMFNHNSFVFREGKPTETFELSFFFYLTLVLILRGRMSQSENLYMASFPM